jgi:hypothetical protein
MTLDSQTQQPPPFSFVSVPSTELSSNSTFHAALGTNYHMQQLRCTKSANPQLYQHTLMRVLSAHLLLRLAPAKASTRGLKTPGCLYSLMSTASDTARLSLPSSCVYGSRKADLVIG